MAESMVDSQAEGPGDKEASVNEHLPFRGVENDTYAYILLDPRLNEFRYIWLEPGHQEDDIICTLVYTHLRPYRSPVSYEAVSYCWGDVDDTVDITIRCPTSKRRRHSTTTIAQKFRITRNLEALLRAFRYENGTRVLWVDAICINQGDPEEKPHQVGSMGKIYASSTGVLVWLGNKDIPSELLIGGYTITGDILGESYTLLTKI